MLMDFISRQYTYSGTPPYDHLVITAIFFQTKGKKHWLILLFWRPR